MTTYGDNQEPGIITDLTSSAAVPTSGEAPSNLGIVGQADLANATSPADTSKVYQVTRASKAVEWFGPKDSSLLTQGVIDALNEDAYPVYAAVAEATSVTDEDHSSASSTTVELDNAPIREDADDVTVSLDGTDQTPNIVYDDVSTYSPKTGECYVNPVRGKVEVNAVPSTSLDISYDHFDYSGGIDVMVDKVPDVIDFLTPLSENQDVVDDANLTVGNMEEDYDLALAVGGADIHVSDTSNFTQQYDDSRTQVVYPTRFEDKTSAVAAYVGFKAQLGLDTTPINKRLSTNKRIAGFQADSMNRAQRGSLIDNQVVPLADEARGVRIVDDPTTVSDSNTDEGNLKYGFNRLVADYIIETTRDNQKPFIGKLNSATVRNTLEGMVSEQLTQLQESNVVISYEVNVLKEDAVTAGLEMQVDLVEPLRFIENTVTIGNGG
jgi:hypothetical protein